MTYILNFSHPLKPEVLERLAPCQEVLIPFHLQLAVHEKVHPKRQIETIVDNAAEILAKHGAKLNGTFPILVVVPGISEGTALLMAELHGRLGNFPSVLAIRRLNDGTYGLYKNSANDAILRLEQLRNSARLRRAA
jgi:hypothetical protein